MVRFNTHLLNKICYARVDCIITSFFRRLRSGWLSLAVRAAAVSVTISCCESEQQACACTITCFSVRPVPSETKLDFYILTPAILKSRPSSNQRWVCQMVTWHISCTYNALQTWWPYIIQRAALRRVVRQNENELTRSVVIEHFVILLYPVNKSLEMSLR